MTLRNRLILLFICLALTLMASLVLFERFSLEQIDRIDQEQDNTNRALLSNSVESLSQIHDLFAEDYSYWDGMATAVENRDQEWLESELSGAPDTYEIDAVQVLDRDLNELFSVYRAGSQLDFPPEVFRKLPGDNQTPVTFFWMSNTGKKLLRIKVSAISPNSLPKTSLPVGYLLSVKIWDQNTLATLAKKISARVTVGPYLKQPDPEQVFIILPSLETQPLMISAHFSHEFVHAIEQSFYWQKVVLATVSLLFVVGTASILHLVVVKPVRKIIATLSNCEALSLKASDFSSTDEFVILKRMVDDFIQQTQSLLKQNTKYEELTEALKTAMQELNRSRGELASEFDKSLRLSRAVEVTSDAVLMTDAEGNIIYANPAWEHLNQYSLSEVEGKNPRLVKSNKTNPTLYKEMWKSLSEGDAFTTEEIINRRRDGSEYNARVSVNPIRENGQNIFYVGVVQDITDRKTMDRLKTDFISLASHQLRTPLTSLRWLLELITTRRLGKTKQDDLLKEMQSSTMKMIAMVNGLLNISRLESGRMIVEAVPVDVPGSIKKLLKEVAYLIERKNLDLTVELAKVPKIKLDPLLLRELVYNLLMNAINYTPKSGQILLRLIDQPKDLLLEVKDTGIGIPLSEQAKIFEKFYRASNAVETQADGSGLGLYLVKLIVDALNGSITFSSTPGVGTTFSIRLPKQGVTAKAGEVSLTSQIGVLPESDKPSKSHH